MERRFFILCLLSFIMFAEGSSWMTAGGLGPCLVRPEHSQSASNDNSLRNCPTFLAGTLLVFGRATDLLRHDDNDKVVVAMFTVVLAISTIGLWLATINLWRAGERQISAVEVANRISRENMIGARRAWLSVENVKLIHPTRFAEDGFLLRVEATVKNLGQTPATSVRLDFESYYAIENIENFPAANERVLSRSRKSPKQLGTAIFPQDTLVQREMWDDEQKKIEKSINILPDGKRTAALMVFVTVSYLVVGDEKRHVTHHAHGLLNIPIGTEVADGQAILLAPEPFIAGEID